MITGVEIAGLVLGAVPVVLSALEQYRKGFESAKVARQYLRHLKSLQRNLDAQFQIYRNTLERLLSNTVSESQLRTLLKDPQGPYWSTPDVQQCLQSFLCSSYGPFCDTIGEFHDVVKEIQERFQCDAHSQVMTPGSHQTCRSLQSIELLDTQEPMGARA